MRGYRALAVALAKSQLREPVGFFFLLIFPPGLLLVLGLIFGNDPAPEFGGRGFVDQMLPGLTVIALLIVGIMVVPQNLLGLRERGALTRLRVTPLKPATFVAADLTVNYVLGLVGALLALVAGLVVFRVELPSSVAMVLLALAFGHLAMLAIGYALAAVLPSAAAAVGIGNGLMVLLMMVSGTMIPTAVLPDGVRVVQQASPVFHVAELVGASWAGEPWPWVSVVVLLGIMVVFGAFGIGMFRWDRAK